MRLFCSENCNAVNIFGQKMAAWLKKNCVRLCSDQKACSSLTRWPWTTLPWKVCLLRKCPGANFRLEGAFGGLSAFRPDQSQTQFFLRSLGTFFWYRHQPQFLLQNRHSHFSEHVTLNYWLYQNYWYWKELIYSFIVIIVFWMPLKMLLLFSNCEIFQFYLEAL